MSTTFEETPTRAEDVLRGAVEAAALAPSSRDSQPWLFRVDGNTVDVYVDRARSLGAFDPDDRELAISVGAGLLNLRVAVEAAGFEACTELLADEANPDLLARVVIGPPCQPGHDVVELMAALPLRRTNRRPYDGRKVGAKLRRRMEAAVQSEGARVYFLEDELHRRLAGLVAAGDRALLADRRTRRAQVAWLRGRRRTLTRVLPVVRRRVAARDRSLAEHTRGLAVLATDGDTVRDWLVAGQALERALLTLTALKGAASFLNAPVEVEDLRAQVAALLPRPGVPQLVLRVGYPTWTPPDPPRRPVDELLAC